MKNLTSFQSTTRSGVTVDMIVLLHNTTSSIATTQRTCALPSQTATSSAAPVVSTVDLSDYHLLKAAEKAGTFDFLNSPEEDIYNDLIQ